MFEPLKSFNGKPLVVACNCHLVLRFIYVQVKVPLFCIVVATSDVQINLLKYVGDVCFE